MAQRKWSGDYPDNLGGHVYWSVNPITDTLFDKTVIYVPARVMALPVAERQQWINLRSFELAAKAKMEREKGSPVNGAT